MSVWPTREVVLREMAIADADRRVERARRNLAAARINFEATRAFLLARSVPNRLAGAEINEDGDAI